MNLTLGTLDELKTHLLAAELRADTRWDAAITTLGRGVVGRFEGVCRRQFARREGDTFVCSADRSHVSLPRYPVEEVSTVELCAALATGWQALSDPIAQLSPQSGLAYFDAVFGGPSARLRITYTGGYALEEDTSTSTVAVPSALAPLHDRHAVPADLKFAWLLQCEHAWGLRDKLGLAVAQDKAAVSPEIIGLSRLGLVPEVEAILRAYRRASLT